jgi:DNA-binding NarL/FixJ family response regulator
MAERVRSFDWASTPLGPIGGWPSSLREAVSICLRSRFQLAIYWGPQVILLYHDEQAALSQALDAGAAGFVLKRSAGCDLAAAVDAVLRGETYVSPVLNWRPKLEGDK